MLILLLALEVSGGCSFIFVRRRPANHAQLPSFECTSSQVAPTIDTVFAVTTPLGAGLSALNDPLVRTWTTAAFAGAWTAALAASAIYGYETTASCRAAQAQLVARQRTGRVAPGGGTPVVIDPEMPAGTSSPGP